MTGRLWPSALVAALFAIHPLRVQSVAWISERKDVLSGLFFVLAISAYVRYVRAPPAIGRYAVVCLFYVLGLLAKPMLVTLPMVLLLLDYWPLRRWQPRGTSFQPVELDAGRMPTLQGDAGRMPTLQGDAGKMPTLRQLLVEKIPLLLLAAADSALTVLTQVDAIQSLKAVSWSGRIANALMAYVSYLGCFFWPQGLAILYPRTINGFSAGTDLTMFAILCGLSAGALLLRRKAPYLLVGWLWSLGMLVPVIGLLQVGGQKMADRYTYLPQIGLAVGLVWAAADLAGFFAARAGSEVRRASRFLLALSAAASLAALAAGAWQQTTYWRDSETLWVRDMMYPNIIAHYNLGLALAKTDRHREAIEQYQAALAIDPNDQDSHNNLGLSYEALGKLDDAAREFRWILAEIQKAVDADNKLAEELQLQGKSSEAQEHRRAAREKTKESVDADKNLARIIAAQRKG
jgi:tetratricopeptide (TPR) repeat protein